MFCPQCGNKIPLQDQKFCDRCGFDLSKVVKENVSQTNEKHTAPVQQSLSLSSKSQKAGVKKRRYWIAYLAFAIMAIGLTIIVNVAKNSLTGPKGTRISANDLVERAKTKYERKDYRGAIADFTNAIELKPDEAVAYGNRGLAKKGLEDYQGAIADFTKAIELKPNLAGAYFNRGLVKSLLKDLQGAIADHTKAIELNLDYGKAYHNRGLAYGALGLYDKALADFVKAIELGESVPQNLLDMCK